jgi:hypothetical protein
LSWEGQEEGQGDTAVCFEDDDDKGAALVIAPQADKDKDKARKKNRRGKEEKGDAESAGDGVEKPLQYHKLSRVLSTGPSPLKGKCGLRDQLRHIPH